MTMFLTLTSWCRSAHACRKLFNVCRWYSSGNTWAHSHIQNTMQHHTSCALCFDTAGLLWAEKHYTSVSATHLLLTCLSCYFVQLTQNLCKINYWILWSKNCWGLNTVPSLKSMRSQVLHSMMQTDSQMGGQVDIQTDRCSNHITYADHNQSQLSSWV